MGVAHRAVHPRVIGQRPHPLRIQPAGGVLDLGAREAIDDAARSLVAGEEAQQLLARLVALNDFVGNVRPVERGGKDLRAAQAQLVDDVFAGVGVGGRGQRDSRHAGEQRCELAERAIFRPEVVPPLGDAVRLVDGEQRDPRPPDHFLETRRDDPFGGDVEEIEVAIEDRAADVEEFLPRQRRVQRGGAHPSLLQRFHLIPHQRDQRRDHDADAVAHQRRNLEAQRLARAGRKQHHRVAARDDVVDHLGLPAAKVRIAVDPLENRERVFPVACLGGEHGDILGIRHGPAFAEDFSCRSGLAAQRRFLPVCQGSVYPYPAIAG